MKGNITVGHPIDVATGAMHNTYTDASIPGRFDLTWERFYSTALIESSDALGSGWSNRYFCSLRYSDAKYHFTDAQGAETVFSDPDNRLKKGEAIRDLGAFTELRWHDNRFTITQWDIDSGEIYSFVFKASSDGKISPLQEINDATGQGLEFAYDKQSRLAGIRQKLEKRTLILRYSPQGLIDQIEFLSSDKKIRKTLASYAYDSSGRLTTVTDALGNKDNFQYDKNNRIVLEQGKDGSQFSFKYEKKGRCIRSVGIDGYDEKTLKYLENAQWTEVTDSLGNVRRFHHNANGQVLREINPLGAEYLTDYDEHGRIITKTDPLEGKTTFEYDVFGNRSAITDALGQTTEIQHNECHLPVKYANAAGNQWKRNYDVSNQLTTIADPQGNAYHLNYDDRGNLIEITDPLDNCLRQSFTGTGVLHAATDWQGNVTSYKSDEFGRLIQKTDPLGASTRYAYDTLNQLTAVSYPDGTNNHYQYDKGGNLSQVTDRNSNITRYRYAPCKRLLERTDPLGNRLFFGWGSEPQRLEAVTNAKGEVYHFEYNPVGWVIGETGFDGRELGFEYDLAGNRIASINGLGERISYQRDALGRLTQQRFPDGITADFNYDNAGFLQSAVNSDSAIEFKRDSLGRIISETQNGHHIEREYDSVGNLAVLESSLGHRIDYSFDANGLLASFSKNKANGIQIERDVRGFETGRMLPGGVRLNQEYDAVGRLLEQELMLKPDDQPRWSLDSAKALVKRSYQYDKAQLVGIQDQTWGKTTYIYDPAEHLISALRDSGESERFSYDANDNLTEITRDSEQATLTYGRGDRLQKKDDTVYEYDDQGRLILKQETSESGEIWESRYTWDALDQLRSFENPEGKVWEYAYDAFGRRILKKAPDGERHGFVWDDDVVLHETQDSELSASWAFDPHSFAPLCKYERGGAYSVVTDHLGTPQEMIDQFGRHVWQVDYFALGVIKGQTKGVVDCPVRFQGQWWDEETGFHYNRYRYYSPKNGRYVACDPIRLAGGFNTYTYCPNPIEWFDPYGLIIVYRNLRPEEDAGSGLQARRPGRNMPASGHVRNGSTHNGSQYISTTADPAVAAAHREEGQVTVRFDTDDVVPDRVGNLNILDVSTPEGAAKHGLRGPAKNYAVASSEVLVEGEVPAGAIEEVDPSSCSL